MISYSVFGLQLPTGAPFRQRTIYAATNRLDLEVPWVVSVVDFDDGPQIEAHFHLDPSAIIATDLAFHSSAPDVLEKVKPLLDAAGWKPRTVRACKVRGCDRPTPMWAASDRPLECWTCSARSVLACSECGQPDPCSYITREAMLAANLCFTCSHWLGRVADPPQVVTHGDWHVYGIGTGSGPRDCKGFGGRRFTVTFDDGRTVNTDDLWSGGEIPERYRSRFVPNARVDSR